MADSSSVWSPSDPIPDITNFSSVVIQRFIATEGQTLFTITNFLYTPGSSSIFAYLNGVLLAPTIDVIETSTTQITLAIPATAGQELLVVGYIGYVNAVADPFYLGPKASAPIVDNQGITLTAAQEGYTYWNTFNSTFFVWDGDTWQILVAGSAVQIAVNVSVADAGAFFIAGDVENILQELGASDFTNTGLLSPTPGTAEASKAVVLGVNKDINELGIVDIISALGTKILSFLGVASAVNYISVSSAATGNKPFMQSTGEANTGLDIKDSNGVALLELDTVASAVNRLKVTAGVTTAAVDLEAAEANSDLNIKRTGTTGDVTLDALSLVGFSSGTLTFSSVAAAATFASSAAHTLGSIKTTDKIIMGASIASISPRDVVCYMSHGLQGTSNDAETLIHAPQGALSLTTTVAVNDLAIGIVGRNDNAGAQTITVNWWVGRLGPAT